MKSFSMSRSLMETLLIECEEQILISEDHLKYNLSADPANAFATSLLCEYYCCNYRLYDEIYKVIDSLPDSTEENPDVEIIMSEKEIEFFEKAAIARYYLSQELLSAVNLSCSVH